MHAANLEYNEAAYGVATAAKSGKRIRELVREFPDFFYAPGKKKFLVTDAHYDMLSIDMRNLGVLIPNAALDKNEIWTLTMADLNANRMPFWYALYALFSSLMWSCPGTGWKTRN